MKQARTLITSLILLVTLLTEAKAYATDYITDVMVIGGTKNETNDLKTTLTAQGWTVINQDLNAGVGGDYIFLLYKSESNTDGFNWGYITDFYICNDRNAPDEIEHNERTYHLVPYDGGEYFINSKGDLNRGAEGDYIRLYYTTYLFTDNRTVTGINFNTTQNGAVGVNGGTTGYDLNTGAGGDYIYMHFTTSTTNPLLSGLGTIANPFLINSTTDWNRFSEMIEYDRLSNKYYKLTNNISVSTMVGTSEHPFKGTFNGNSKTLTVNISGSEQGVAPFHYINGATIQNLTVGGTVTCSAYHAAGLVGFCSGGTNTVTDCAVATNINASGYGGGIVGHGLSSTLILSNSYYSGTISGFGNYAGGLLGWCDAMTLTINNCLFKGAFMPSGSGKYHPIACANHGSTVTAYVTDTYYFNTITPTATGDKTIPEAEGTPVNTTFALHEWDIPVVAADGDIYYTQTNISIVTIHNGSSTSGTTLPIKQNKYFMCQQIFLPEEIGTAGAITSISFLKKGGPWIYQEGIQVYMTHTDKEVFESNTDVVPLNESDMVFNGTYHIAGEGWTPIVLDTPFEYDGNRNLLICCYATTITWSDYLVYFEYLQSETRCRTLHCFDNNVPISMDDWSNYPNCFYEACRNAIQIQILPAPFPGPSNLNVSQCTEVMATLTWAAPDTDFAITGYAYQYKKKSDAYWPNDVTTVNSATTFANLNGLQDFTEYEFRVKALGSSLESSYEVIRFTTAKQLPYEQGFENGLDGWSMVNPYWTRTKIDTHLPHDGEKSFRFEAWDDWGNIPEDTPQYLISPRFAGTGALNVSFYYASQILEPKFQIGYSSTDDNPSSFTWVDEVTAHFYNWEHYEHTFPVGTRYFALKFDYADNHIAYVDDFSFDWYSAYPKPTNLAASVLTDHSATLTWTATDASATGYAYQYKKLTDATWSAVDTVSATSVTLNGLTLNTKYDFRMKALFTGNNVSNTISTRFMTEGETESVPHFQGFEDGLGGWRIVDGYSRTNIYSRDSAYIHDGNYSFEFEHGSDTPQYLFSPQLDNNTSIKVSFFYRNYSENNDSYYSAFTFGYSSTTKDPAAFTWSSIFISNNFSWNRFLAFCPASTKYVVIAWVGGAWLYVDNISIETYPIIVDATHPFTEGFEDIWIPECWSNPSSYGSDDFYHHWIQTHNQHHSGSAGAFSDYYGDVYLIMPELNLANDACAAQLSFWSCYYSLNKYVKSSVVLIDGDTETELWTPDIGTLVNGTWYETNIDLSAYLGQTIKLAFKYEGENAHGWYVDDVEVSIPIPTPTNITQTVHLAAGVNWFSTNVEVTLDDLQATLVAALPSANNITIRSQNNGVTTYNGTRWRGSLNTLDVAQMYMVTVNAACEITLEGMPVNPAEHPVTIHSGVNWIAFPLNENMSVTDAFVGFGVASGDIIKSSTSGVATYTNRWRGSLDTLMPGNGYIYISNTTNDRTLIFQHE